MYNVRDVFRKSKQTILQLSEIEKKTREATSNEKWGPTGSQMMEIARATHSYNDFPLIMNIIWKRLDAPGKNWRHCYKALLLLDYLLKNGSEQVAREAKVHLVEISTLNEFQYIDEKEKDRGLSVRERAKAIVELLNDDARLANEREKATVNKGKFSESISSQGGTSYGAYSSRDQQNQQGHSPRGPSDAHGFTQNDDSDDDFDTHQNSAYQPAQNQQAMYSQQSNNSQMGSQYGMNQGYNQQPNQGFGNQGFNSQGPNQGFNSQGPNQGFNSQGPNQGFNQGANPQAFNSQGFNSQGPNQGFNQGANPQAFNSQGFNSQQNQGFAGQQQPYNPQLNQAAFGSQQPQQFNQPNPNSQAQNKSPSNPQTPPFGQPIPLQFAPGSLPPGVQVIQGIPIQGSIQGMPVQGMPIQAIPIQGVQGGQGTPGGPGTPGAPGQPVVLRAFVVAPGQPFPGQPVQGQPFPGQPIQGQPFPGQQMQGQQMQGQQMQGQQMQGQQMQGQQVQGQQVQGQPNQGQQFQPFQLPQVFQMPPQQQQQSFQQQQPF